MCIGQIQQERQSISKVRTKGEKFCKFEKSIKKKQVKIQITVIFKRMRGI